MKKRIGVQGFAMFATVGAIAVFPRFFLRSQSGQRSEKILFLIGLITSLLGFLLRIASRGSKAEGSCDGKTLIRHGPYMLVRNPMYVGTLLIGAGLIFAVFQWWVCIFFCTVYMAIYIPQIKREETVLLERFGQAYRDYCTVTPRFFPRPASAVTTNPRRYVRFKWAWIKKELPSVILVVIFMAGIRYWTTGGQATAIFSREDIVGTALVIACFIGTILFYYEPASTAGKT